MIHHKDNVGPASKDCFTSRVPSSGRDWLTNVDAPAGFEANQKLGGFFNWHQVRDGLPSTMPVALARTVGPPVSASTSVSSGPTAKFPSSASDLASRSPVSEGQPLIPRSLKAKNRHDDDLSRHLGELQSRGNTNDITSSAPSANETHQTAPSSVLTLHHTRHFMELQPPNMSNLDSSASVSNKGFYDFRSCSKDTMPPCSHQHFLPPPLTPSSPSRQRSLNDLMTLMPRPPSIARPKSIPISNASRFIPDSLVPFKHHAGFQNGLHLQTFASLPFLCNNSSSSSNNNSNNNSSNSNSGIHHNVVHSNAYPATEPRFVPMLSITRPDRTGRDLTPFPQQNPHYALPPLKFSPRYHGMHTENNASMEHLPPGQNCALWLTNLPSDIRERELLASVRNTGRIYATYINYPDGRAHATSAAKLVFFTPEAAQKLLAHCTPANPMVIRGHRVKIALNRIKYAKRSMDNGESRVLIITGHKDFVNETSLTAYFEARFQFQIDEVATLITHRDRAVVEYKFASYRCQAQMGIKALLLERPSGLEMVEYGDDPCEVPSEVTTSFTVAGQRIQGRGLLAKDVV